MPWPFYTHTHGFYIDQVSTIVLPYRLSTLTMSNKFYVCVWNWNVDYIVKPRQICRTLRHPKPTVAWVNQEIALKAVDFMTDSICWGYSRYSLAWQPLQHFHIEVVNLYDNPHSLAGIDFATTLNVHKMSDWYDIIIIPSLWDPRKTTGIPMGHLDFVIRSPKK